MSARNLFIADDRSFGFKDADGEVLTPEFLAGPGVYLHERAARIAAVCKGRNAPNILFIDLFIRFQDGDYAEASDLGGIALLKFLRIRGVNQHVVLLSPWNSNELLRMNPGYYVLASPGVTVAPFRFDWTQIKGSVGRTAEELAQDIAPESEVLRTYLRPGIELAKDERHNWANWWGIDRLWYVNEVAEGRSPGADRLEEESYPTPLRERIIELRNQEALFCHGHADKLVHVHLRCLEEAANGLQQEEERLEQLIADLLAQRSATEDDLQRSGANAPASLTEALALLKVLRPGTDPFLARVLSEQATRLLPDATRRRSLLDRLTELQAELDRIEERKTDTERIRSGTEDDIEQQQAIELEQFRLLNALVRETASARKGIAIHTMRYKLKEHQPRILLIDDQANDGWADVMQSAIFGDPSDAFRSIAPPPGRTIDTDYYDECVRPVLNDHKPQVILLDLRLSKETGAGQEVDDLSGARLLRLIRKDYPGQPVIMTTASNKAWSLERLINLGCDGYWIKEGLDLDIPVPASVKNYARFLELIDLTTSDIFGNVKRFGERIRHLERADTRFWWEKPVAKPTIRGATKLQVLSILAEGLYLMRDHLSVVELGRVYARPANDWFYPSMVPMHLTRIIEEIHGSFESSAIGRTDKVAEQLLRDRNSATHVVQPNQQATARSWDHKKLFDWLNRFMDWLNGPPAPMAKPKVKDIIRL